MSETLSANCPITVIKIGGSILKNSKAYRRAARFIWNRHRAAPEERLVIVVSAQEGMTDKLAGAAKRIFREPGSAALDLLWSTGELRSVAILVLHLQAVGISAAPLNIHETGLSFSGDRPDSSSAVPLVRLNARRLRSALTHHPAAVVPGFFATNTQSAVVSLGRGGSDLTAVVLAEGLEACRCELLKDVPGYFSSDPHRDPTARHVPFLTFEDALEFADGGCDLVQRQAIVAAARCNLPLVIRSLDEALPVSRISAEQTGSERTDFISAEAVAT